jgi:integrase
MSMAVDPACLLKTAVRGPGCCVCKRTVGGATLAWDRSRICRLQRIQQRIGVVLDIAQIKGWLSNEVSLRSVRKGLPRQTEKAGHFVAMPYPNVPALIAKLVAAPPITGRDALRFTIYNAVRSNETRFAVWTELDLDNAVWTIPGERMKVRETLVVPLSPPAVALLRRRWNERTSDAGLVFINNGERPISDMTMTKLLRDAGITGVTVQGFRSAFTDWAAETTEFPKEVADKALAHKLPNRVEAAYRRMDFFNKRRDLMAQWAAYLDAAPAYAAEAILDNVPISEAARRGHAGLLWSRASICQFSRLQVALLQSTHTAWRDLLRSCARRRLSSRILVREEPAR